MNKINTIRLSVDKDNGWCRFKMMNMLGYFMWDDKIIIDVVSDRNKYLPWSTAQDILMSRGMVDEWDDLRLRARPATVEVNITELPGYGRSDYVVIEDKWEVLSERK